MPADFPEDNPLTLIDGVQTSSVSVADRGFQFGDGFFETMLCFEGGLPLKAFHLRRLEESIRRLKFNLQLADVQQYLQQFMDLRTERALTPKSAIKIIITRGVGGRGYMPSVGHRPSVVLLERPVFASGPVILKECATRLAGNPAIAGLKHLNRLEYCMAGLELEIGEEGLLLSVAGRVVESLHANIFWVLDGTLFTPSLQECGVKGVFRQYLKDRVLPKLGLALVETESPIDELANAKEVFLCNAVRGLMPVHALASSHWQTGPVSSMIQSEIKREFGDAFC